MWASSCGFFCIKLLIVPQLLFCKFPCGHTNFEIRIQGGFNEAQQYSRMCTAPPITEPNLHQDLRPLQAENNCIGRSEQGEEADAVEEFQCLRCEGYEPDPPLGFSAYNKLVPPTSPCLPTRGILKRPGRQAWSRQGALSLQLSTPRFGEWLGLELLKQDQSQWHCLWRKRGTKWEDSFLVLMPEQREASLARQTAVATKGNVSYSHCAQHREAAGWWGRDHLQVPLPLKGTPWEASYRWAGARWRLCWAAPRRQPQHPITSS